MTYVKPPASLLMGDSGQGKTDALISYIEAGLELFVLVTEPTGVETLVDSARRRKVDMNKLHWKLVKPSNMNIASMITAANNTNLNSVGELQKQDNAIKLDKRSYRQYITMLENVNNFQCDRTGKSYGNVGQWDDTRAFAIDSMTGVNQACTQMQIGNRGTLTLPDYNVVQNALENLLTAVCGFDCFVAVTAHIEFEKDEVTGRMKLMASTVGKKLAPKIPIHFSDVIRARFDGKSYSWSTVDDETHLKTRNLLRRAGLQASFVPIVEVHRKRKVDATYSLEEDIETVVT